MAANIDAHAIDTLLAKVAKSHPRILGQPTDDDIFKMTEVLYPILHNTKYNMITVPGHQLQPCGPDSTHNKLRGYMDRTFPQASPSSTL